jgi:hypothetical protein
VVIVIITASRSLAFYILYIHGAYSGFPVYQMWYNTYRIENIELLTFLYTQIVFVIKGFFFNKILQYIDIL